MTKQQFSKSLMCGDVKKYLSGYPDLIAGEPSLAACDVKLSFFISQIEGANTKQTSVHEGKTETKLSNQEALRRSVNHVRLHVYADACSAGREETKAIVGISDTGFSKLRDTEQQTRARLILGEARKYLPELQARGITEDMLNALEVDINRFSDALHARNSSVAERISAGKEIKKLFSEIAVFFRVEMKAAMETFRTSHPEFYKGYTAIRRAKGLPKRSKKAAAKEAKNNPTTVKDAPDTAKDASNVAKDAPDTVKDTSTPVNGTSKPVNGMSKPVNGTSTPANGTSTPVNGTTNPVMDTPVTGEDAPATALDAAAG